MPGCSRDRDPLRLEASVGKPLVDGCEVPLPLAKHIQHPGVEVIRHAPAVTLEDDLHRLLMGKPRLVGLPAAQGVIDVGEGHDAAGKGDLLLP